MNQTSLKHKEILGVLLSKGLLDEQKKQFLEKKFGRLGEVVNFMLKKKLVSQEDLAKASAQVLNLPFIKIQGRQLDLDILQIIPLEISQRLKIVAVDRNDSEKGRKVIIAAAEPYRLTEINRGPLHSIEKEKGIAIEIQATTLADVDWALKAYEEKLKQAPTPPAGGSDSSSSIQFSNLPKIDLTKLKLSAETLKKFPVNIVKKYQVALFEVTKNGIFKVGLVDAFDPKTQALLDFIEKKNQIKFEKYQITPADLNWALGQYEKDDEDEKDEKPLPPPAEPLKPKEEPKELKGVKIKNGIYYLDESAIGTPQISLTRKEDQRKDDALEETNLDKFLGKLVESKRELAVIMETGFIPKIVAGLLSLGVRDRASDIHIEPTKTVLRLRYRIDGDLREYMFLPLKLHPPIISRIKILSGLKIDEQRIPQDGRYNAIAYKHEIDVRVSTMPTVHGEKIVMRILDKTTSQFTLNQLGLEGRNLEILEKEIIKPWGVIISTGPTGSGKTTTLYAVINQISKPKVNVVTLEDPVEYDIPGINQAQVRPKIGFSFAEGLRSLLRQDPNIIMVGEIRDSETASLVTHAALTGHLVLTTLHTNNAASALPRLINMRVEPYLITSSINAIIAQRLVRKLCPKCRVKIKVPETVLKNEGISQGEFYGPGQGCDSCFQGYKGRLGIFEVFAMTGKIEELAVARAPASQIEKVACEQGMITMRQDGLQKALKGLVALGDVIQATSE